MHLSKLLVFLVPVVVAVPLMEGDSALIKNDLNALEPRTSCFFCIQNKGAKLFHLIY